MKRQKMTRAMTRAVRMYRSDKGIWHVEYERGDGSRRWSTLGTRDEAKAKAEFERLKAALEKAWAAP